ncbi:hypothetical protein [Paenibacillus crassostreae]|uniref:F0F1-type ATP synthase n=1 Tax=Paenibacillus crassostreae TaxID=1763538 RepID=A0A167DST4_9BACL|nr:hypothetical protein [Paenibacillus crassostreae]AOZ91102.1 hypothetical protein LPB68_02035 [Paenibacillus crassostreae]OAB74738.1 F0F1-type ATP synthase [Paenibacillus crassostreae]
MKTIIKLSIFSVLILLPYFIINNINLEQNRQTLIIELRYNRAIDTATQDAARALLTNSSQRDESQYETLKRVKINKEEAVETFFNSLYLNFGVFNDTAGQGVVDNYVPVVMIVGYDGYYVYSWDEYINASGEKEIKHVWSPKKPYDYVDQDGNTFAFTLDDYVVVNRNVDQKWVEGFRSEITSEASISLLNDSDKFDQVRRTTIVNALQQDLEMVINQYNRYSKRLGVAYTFTIPLISEEDWHNTINDVGVLAFVQGIPMGEKYYNNYALGGSRIVKKEIFNGIIANGRKYYYSRNACVSTFTTEEMFTSERDAASSGYIPLDCTVGYRY